MKKKILLTIYFILLSLFAAWTWTLTAPNLVLSNASWYWQTQTYLWEHFYGDRPWVTYTYALLIVCLFLVFLGIYFCFRHQHQHFSLAQIKNIKNIKNIKKNLNFSKLPFFSPQLKSFALTIFLLCIPLLFSFNALSFDVFNYLFNAKMVAVYQANPHVKTALDFSFDPWTRFMHNVHTTAPYGYGWTAVSLLPYYLGFGKLLPTWLMFRLFNLCLLLASLAVVVQLQLRRHHHLNLAQLWLFFGNPLVLIELIGNIHNDLWMMLPMLVSILLLLPKEKRQLSWSRLLGSCLLYAFSLSIKYATLALAPLWLYLLVSNYRSRFCPLLQKCSLKMQLLVARLLTFVNHYFFDFAALLMFLPLLTSRSQRFHPWYLTWSLIFLPLCKSKIIRLLALVLSLSSLCRYLPYLWENGYADNTVFIQQLISLLPAAVVSAAWLFYFVGSWLRQRCKFS